MRGFWHSTLPNEKASFISFAAVMCAALWLGLADGFAKLIPIGIGCIAILILILLSIFGAIWARSYTGLIRWRAGLIAPCLLAIAVILCGPAAFISRYTSAYLYLHSHHDEFRGSTVKGYSVLPFREGIPDGGLAIIRTDLLRPDRLPQSSMVNLVGERIHYCDKIRQVYYRCAYD